MADWVSWWFLTFEIRARYVDRDRKHTAKGLLQAECLIGELWSIYWQIKHFLSAYDGVKLQNKSTKPILHRYFIRFVMLICCLVSQCMCLRNDATFYLWKKRCERQGLFLPLNFRLVVGACSCLSCLCLRVALVFWSIMIVKHMALQYSVCSCLI